MRIKTILLFLPLFLVFNPLIADEFEVKSFKLVPEDLAAIKYSKKDINGNTCAIIKVFTDLDNLSFNTNIGIVDIKYKPGEYWIYVPPGEQRLKFIKNGYISYSYDIPLPIESKKVYRLVLTQKNKQNIKEGKGTIVLNSEPSEASVSIDGFPDVTKKTPCTFEDYRTGQYLFKITKKHYASKDTLLTIKKNKVSTVFINLQPKWGALKLTSNNDHAQYYIDNNYVGKGKTLKMIRPDNAPSLGEHKVEARAKNYYNQIKQIKILSGKLNTLHFNLDPKIGRLRVDSDPQGASVYLENEYIGSTPVEKSEIRTGFYKLELKEDDFLDVNKQIHIKEDETTSIFKNLQLQKSFSFNTEPSGAEVYIDDKYKGKTPVNVNIRPDNQKLKIVKKGFRTYSTKLDHHKDHIYKKLDKKSYKTKSRTSRNRSPAKENYMSHYYGGGYVNGINAQGGFFTMMGGHVFLELQILSISPYNGDRKVNGIVSEDYISKYENYLSEDGYIATDAMSIIQGINLESEEKPVAGGAFLIKAGYLAYAPVPFSLNLGYGKRALTNYYHVYQVTEDYEDSDNNQMIYGTTIAKEPIEKEYSSYSMGAKIFVPVTSYGGFQLGADYWLDSEQGSGWAFAGGIYFYPGQD